MNENENEIEVEASSEAEVNSELFDGSTEAETDLESKISDGEPDVSPDALLLRIAELERELEDRRSRDERNRLEREEFRAVFPEADPDALPDEVLERVRGGVPLAAAYALYERIRKNELDAAKLANKKNALSLHSKLDGRTESGYFSADEVRMMSSTQVRENFSRIIASMKHW